MENAWTTSPEQCSLSDLHTMKKICSCQLLTDRSSWAPPSPLPWPVLSANAGFTRALARNLWRSSFDDSACILFPISFAFSFTFFQKNVRNSLEGKCFCEAGFCFCARSLVCALSGSARPILINETGFSDDRIALA